MSHKKNIKPFDIIFLFKIFFLIQKYILFASSDDTPASKNLTVIFKNVYKSKQDLVY